MNGPQEHEPAAGLTVVVDGEARLEYDREKPLSEAQLASLRRMDERMAEGIRLGGAEVEKPDQLQRAQFVAVQLLEALSGGNEALSAAGCAYLASRLPDLTQVKARLVRGIFSVELVFNEPYVREAAVDFTPRRPS